MWGQNICPHTCHHGCRTLFLHSNWLAVIRPVSLRLQYEGQKTLTDSTDAHGVFDTDLFLTFVFWVYILISVWFWLCLAGQMDVRRILREEKREYYFLNTNFSNLTNHFSLSTRLLVNSSTSKKLRLCRKERWLCREYSYEILSVYLCCTVGAPMLHLWCQGAALLLALLFVSLYSGFSVGQIRQISWSSDYNSYANICFFRTRIARIWRIFLGCDMIYIRGIREICGQLNIIHTRICFSNTNRTNLTNLVGCDMVCIRGIREIRGQTNKIHTRIYIFFEH